MAPGYRRVLSSLLLGLPMRTMAFTKTTRYRQRRAYVTVELEGPGSPRWVNVDVLVDTGADYLVLPDAAAIAVGLDPAGGALESVRGVAGTTTMRRLVGCHVTVEGSYRINVDVLFGPGAMPLLGMDAMLAAMETGFQAAYWHYL